MTRVYFKDVRTNEEVKKRFHELVKALHPDCGGDPEEFKAMMNEYYTVFEEVKETFINSKGETYHKSTEETAQQFADKLEKIINLSGVKIEIIGSWVWLSGSTMVYKDTIKEAGYFWSRSKKAWYYTTDGTRSHRRGNYRNLDKLREKWGSVEVETEMQPRLV